MRLLIIITTVIMAILSAVIFTSLSNNMPTNKPLVSDTATKELYSLSNSASKHDGGNYTVILAMSGGGSRASALSYGVLKGLKNQAISNNGVSDSLLSEVDVISSVSGGSFTAAYYGLFGDKIFTNFEDDFLYHDVGSDLLWRALNPRQWLSFSGRTDEAVNYYREKLFSDATFADFDQEGGPLVIINATDLVGGINFPFLQEYFNLMCSDISEFSVASAVAASSAVPILFNPVVMDNHAGCKTSSMFELNDKDYMDSITKSTVAGLQSFENKAQKQYVHLVDGGITDNLGLVVVRDILTSKEKSHLKSLRPEIKSHIVVISIDASVKPYSKLNNSLTELNLANTIDTMTGVQIHRYNDVSKNLIKETIKRISKANSTDDSAVSSYFVDINLQDIPDKKIKDFLNNIPTDFCLDPENIDALIDQGMSQLANNKEFLRFLADANVVN